MVVRFVIMGWVEYFGQEGFSTEVLLGNALKVHSPGVVLHGLIEYYRKKCGFSEVDQLVIEDFRGLGYSDLQIRGFYDGVVKKGFFSRGLVIGFVIAVLGFVVLMIFFVGSASASSSPLSFLFGKPFDLHYHQEVFNGTDGRFVIYLSPNYDNSECQKPQDCISLKGVGWGCVEGICRELSSYG